MAKLTIDVPDALVARIRAAILVPDDTTKMLRPATIAEVQDYLKNQLRAVVSDREASRAAAATAATVAQEVW